MRTAVAICLLACSAAPAAAMMVRVDFAGEVTDNAFGSIEVGDAISGTLVYDTNASSVTGPDFTTFAGLVELSFSVGAFDYQLAGLGSVFAFDDVGGSDALGFGSEPGTLLGPSQSGLVPEGLFILLEGADASLFSLPALPTQFDDSDFAAATFGLSFGPSGPTGTLGSFSAFTVPEPHTLALVLVGALGFALTLRRRGADRPRARSIAVPRLPLRRRRRP